MEFEKEFEDKIIEALMGLKIEYAMSDYELLSSLMRLVADHERIIQLIHDRYKGLK